MTVLERLKELEAKATKGPWEWSSLGGGSPSLMTPHSGRLIVIDAVRKGMNGGALRFSNRHGMVNGTRAAGVMQTLPLDELRRNPDAELIVAMRNALPHLIAVAEAAIQMKEAERVMLDPKSGHGDRSGACDDEKDANRKITAALAELTKGAGDATP